MKPPTPKPLSLAAIEQRRAQRGADHHRRVASLLRRSSVPNREAQARNHEQLAQALERRTPKTYVVAADDGIVAGLTHGVDRRFRSQQ